MTTIAYKEGVLAADSQLTVGGHIRTKSDPKILILQNGFVLGLAGKTNEILHAVQFLNNPYWLENLDKAPTDLKKFEGLGYFKGNVFFFEGSCLPNLMAHPFYAIGSGWEHAMAAMALGMSAPDAIRFASKHDVFTNDEVQIVNVKQEQEAEAPPKRVRRKAQAPV